MSDFCDFSYYGNPDIAHKKKMQHKKNTKKSCVSEFISECNAITPLQRGQKQKNFNSKMCGNNDDIIDIREYNIFHIDSIIKEKLCSKISAFDELQKDLNETLEIIDKTTNPRDVVCAQQQSAFLRRRIQDVQNGFELCLYIFKTADLLENIENFIVR
jgi:hypothetical protein